MDDEQGKEISRTRYEEDGDIAMGPLQKKASKAGDTHTTDRAAESSHADNGSDRPSRKHVGDEGEDIAGETLMCRRCEADGQYDSPEPRHFRNK